MKVINSGVGNSSAVVSWTGISKQSEIQLAYLLRRNFIQQFYLCPRQYYIPSRKVCSGFLREDLKSRFVANTQQLAASPNSNPLDFYFGNKVKEKVDSGHHVQLFMNENSWNTGFALSEINVLQILNCFVKQLNSFDQV